ncbi:MAG: hypothetical protein KU28_00490 [Sulfurovum sp. PC08-66]|nr:MAG: hypothetical protein KU28_00490 [Sulfurovum sp. PC08-66]KIM12445.1 MAG: hypothetical protein KU37_00605 [Sulfuricurvum sp. PC08-66]
MKTNPLVCICVPNYNNEKTLSQTLDSLVNQTYPNIIIKVFDNASTDGSIEILRAYEAKYPYLHVIQNETNIGGEANFTKCIENMEGDYSAVYHSDDLYLPQMVESQVDFLENHLDCVAVSTHAQTIDGNSTLTGERYLPDEYTHQKFKIFDDEIALLKTTLKHGNIITCPSVMARCDVYKNKIAFWNGKEYLTSADLDVWLRLASYGKFAFLTTALMQYRVSESSYSYNLARIRVDRGDIFLVLDAYIDRYKNALEKSDFVHYKFQKFKDNLSVMLNRMILGKPHKGYTIDILDWDLFILALSGRLHAKIYIYGWIAKILSWVDFLPVGRYLLKWKRFGK